MWKKPLEYLRPALVGFLALLLLAMLSDTASTGVIHPPERLSQHLITATTLATAQLERVKTLDYHQLSAAVETWTEDYQVITDFPTYRRQTTVAVDTPERGMSQVTVTVYWHDDANAVRLSLLLAE